MALREVTLEDPTREFARVPLSAELEGRDATVFFLLRRFGCLLCRESASDLYKLKDEFEKAGSRLVAVGHERLGYEDFAAGAYFPGRVLVDADRKLYAAVGAQRAGVLSLLSPWAWRSIAAARGHGFSGNLEGDGMQLGGLLVLSRRGDVLFSQAQRSFDDKPDAAGALAAVRRAAQPEAAPPAAAAAAK